MPLLPLWRIHKNNNRFKLRIPKVYHIPLVNHPLNKVLDTGMLDPFDNTFHTLSKGHLAIFNILLNYLNPGDRIVLLLGKGFNLLTGISKFRLATEKIRSTKGKLVG